MAAASHANLKPSRAKSVLTQVHAAISLWPTLAGVAAVSAESSKQIHQNLRLDLKP